MQPPQNPAGDFVPETNLSRARRDELIATIEQAPAAMRQAVADLSEEQLDTPFRNWTIRQIVHHLADSHVNIYIRFKWTLTEECPTIKAYDEGAWSALPDARTGAVQPALELLAAVHGRWIQLRRTMSDEQFTRAFFHPESHKTVTLDEALCYYAWHGRHHTAQVTWRRGHMTGEPET